MLKIALILVILTGGVAGAAAVVYTSGPLSDSDAREPHAASPTTQAVPEPVVSTLERALPLAGRFFPESAATGGPVDILEGEPGSILAIDFARTQPGLVNIIGITAAGVWEDAPETRLLLEDGTELRVVGSSTRYHRDATGTLAAGDTRFEFVFSEASSLLGVATLVVAPSDLVVRNTWEVPLLPGP